MIALFVGLLLIALGSWWKQFLDGRLDRIDHKLDAIEDKLRELNGQQKDS